MSYLKQIQTEIEAMQAEMKEKASIALSNILKEYPEVSAISWCQYVPYFNDGEACEFTMGEIYVLTGDITSDVAQKIADNPYYAEENAGESVDGDEDEISFDILSTWGDDKNKSACDIVEFLESIEDILQSLYGDYASVVITRDHGILVEEFEAPY